MLILHNMRKCVLILLIAFSCAGLHSCAEGAAGVSQEAPELLKAVPSDALCVGLFGRLDHGMEQMIDSLSALRSLDYGKLSRSRAAIALCDIGSVCPLLIIEAGKAGADEKKTAKDAATSKTMAKSKETAKPKAKGRQAAGKGMKT